MVKIFKEKRAIKTGGGYAGTALLLNQAAEQKDVDCSY